MNDLELVINFYKEIRENEILFYTKYKIQDEEAKQEWDAIHFNSIEFFSFLVNENYIKDKKLISFFEDAIVDWYEKLYVKSFTKKVRNNPNHFKEFNKLYKKILK